MRTALPRALPIAILAIGALACSYSLRVGVSTRGSTTTAVSETPSAPARSTRRGLYVARTHELLRDSEQVDALVAFCAQHRIDQVTFYDLRRVVEQEDGPDRLRAALVRLREVGVTHTSAPIGSTSELETIASLIEALGEHAFDGLVTELEYWRECDAPPSTEGERACFQPMVSLLEAIGAVARRSSPPRWVGAYLGYVTQAEAARIAELTDVVLLNYQRPDPQQAFAFAYTDHGSLRERLRYFSGRGAVWPIFYARGESSMADYLARHGLERAETSYLRELDREPWGAAVELAGFQYFDYAALRAALGDQPNASANTQRRLR